MTKNEFKQGDKVYMAYDPTKSAVVTDVCKEGKYDYYVRENGAEYTQGCCEYELLDRRTAFLTRLQSLLREFDASIEPKFDMWSDMSYVDVMIGEECILSTNDYITADNIMDFDKE